MNTTHSVVGELLNADIVVRNGLPTITLQLRQRSRSYSSQHITAVRTYPGGTSGLTLAREHHAALRDGELYRVVADAMGVTADGVVCLLGVQRFHLVATWPTAARQPNSLADEGACRGLVMSMPAAPPTAGAAL